jgi:hypothetical protein
MGGGGFRDRRPQQAGNREHREELPVSLCEDPSCPDPERAEAVETCYVCKRGLCEECVRTTDGFVLCSECWEREDPDTLIELNLMEILDIMDLF